jgi:membrane protein
MRACSPGVNGQRPGAAGPGRVRYKQRDGADPRLRSIRSNQTVNHVAAVPHRLRAGFVSRYVRVFVMLAALLLGALAVGALTVLVTALPGVPGVQRAAAVLGSALVVFAVLLLGARLLLARPAPVRALWPGAILGAAAVTVVLNVGAPLLARLVTRAGPVYGSFATVAGMFALLYLVSQALVYAAEVAAVRHARLWATSPGPEQTHRGRYPRAGPARP